MEKIYDNYFKGRLKELHGNSPKDVNGKISSWIEQLDNVTKNLSEFNNKITRADVKYRLLSSSLGRLLPNALGLEVRSYALLMAFKVYFPNKDWSRDKVTVSKYNKKINEILANRIHEIKGKNNQVTQNKLIREKIEKIEQEINKINKDSSISVLDLVESMELSIWKTGKNPAGWFRDCWAKSFSGTYSFEQAVNSFWSIASEYRYYLIYSLLYESYADTIFKYVLREFERCATSKRNNIHFSEENTLQLEHIFPRTEKPTFNMVDFGFADEKDYNSFVEKIENWTFLHERLNKNVGNNLIFDKAPVYKDQPGWFNKLDNQKLDPSFDVEMTSIVGEEIAQLSGLLGGNSSPLYRTLLELRGLEIAIFAANRF